MISFIVKKHELEGYILKLINNRVFQASDTFLARKICRQCFLEDASLFFLLCYLAASFREGNLFIELQGKAFLPKPMFTTSDLQGEDENFISKDDEEYLIQMLLQGFSEIEMHQEALSSFCRLKEKKLYFVKAYETEKSLQEHVIRLQSSSDKLNLNFPQAELLVLRALSENLLLKEQAEAVLFSLKENFSIISGGPGTGKTYTAAHFLRIFIESYQNEDALLRIALVGPTGKAVSNLEERLLPVVKDLQVQVKPQFEVLTLHALLKRRRFFKNDDTSYLPYDLIVVDEASMVDAFLIEELLSRILPPTKLLLLGDPDQLAPVEPGDVFCALVKEQKVRTHIGSLSLSKRTDVQDIVMLSSLIKEGNKDTFFAFLEEKDPQSPIQVRFFSDNEKNLQDAFKENLPYFHEEMQKDLLHFRILSPLNDGPWGTKLINKAFQTYAEKNNQDSHPLIITKNDYQLKLMNGDMGISLRKGKELYFRKGSIKEERLIPLVLLSQYEYAYCLSTHKSQGSEFNKVLLLLPPGSERFGRRMLYTAVTRARKSVEIWTSKETLSATLSNEGRGLISLFHS